MGRTLDLGFRAGDATLKVPALQKMFPTGEFARSVDNYSMGYSDPWFPTKWVGAWLPERAQYRLEASYIQEQKTSYLIRRRRVINDLEWRLAPTVGFQAGHRYERSEARYIDLIDFNDPKYAGFKGWEHIFLNENTLEKATGSPARAVVSAPYVQWYRDSRNSRIDPTQGSFTQARLEFANQ
jgi:outer membrane protein assembly factor BamA